MKKLSNIILLFMLVFQWTYNYVSYQKGRWECHMQNLSAEAEKSNISTLKTITFQNENEIAWEENGKEFMFDGHLYDVVSMVNTGHSVTINCFSDEKEDSLLFVFHQLFQEKENQPVNSKTLVMVDDINYLSPAYLPFLMFKSNLVSKPEQAICNFFDRFLEITTPPPEV